jgi:hypothetical protein
MVPRPDHHEDREIEAKRRKVDPRAACAQDPLCLEPLEPPPERVLRNADPVGKLPLRQRPLPVERGEGGAGLL